MLAARIFDHLTLLEGTVTTLIAYAPALVLALLILFVGGQRNVPTVDTSLPLDKLVHFVMYGFLGALVTRGWLKAQRPRALTIMLVLAMAVGAGDEIHQRYVPNRNSDIKDWIADALGIAFAATLVLKYWKESSSNAV